MRKWFTEAAIRPLRFVGAILLIMATAPAALAIEDTQENRAKEVDRYFEAMPIETLTREMMEHLANQVPAMQQEAIDTAFPNISSEHRATLSEVLHDSNKLMSATIKYIDFVAIKKIQSDALVSSLTADEIAALANFYASPAGKSAGAKTGKFSEALMPKMMPIIMNAVMRARTEEESK
jgi:hypothetical protein